MAPPGPLDMGVCGTRLLLQKLNLSQGPEPATPDPPCPRHLQPTVPSNAQVPAEGHELAP